MLNIFNKKINFKKGNTLLNLNIEDNINDYDLLMYINDANVFIDRLKQDLVFVVAKKDKQFNEPEILLKINDGSKHGKFVDILEFDDNLSIKKEILTYIKRNQKFIN